MSSIRRDLHHNLSFSQAFTSATVGASGTTAGAIIDTRGYQSIEFVLSIGTRTDGTFTPLIEEGDQANLSDATAVLDQDLFGSEANGAVAVTNGIGRVGMFIGNKRYVRLSVVASGVTTGATGVHAIACLGTPNRAATTTT